MYGGTARDWGRGDDSVAGWTVSGDFGWDEVREQRSYFVIIISVFVELLLRRRRGGLATVSNSQEQGNIATV
ncbi:hypothetical protein [Nostoc sp. WHI]|uniref:hypothetical protein n=1 Tax=Nostoc sp. WHI TaxID=2650611 RepID=UPI0018C74CC7|nr:hypothetical protein [Nostoc sp. WHI]MBG1268639.1 hypothetical protein [Nostoc sp. WHI]